MSGEKKEGDGFVFVMGMLVGFVSGAAFLAYLTITRDASQFELEACNAKLERDRYCVMIAVPSEYELTLPKGESND